MKAKTPLSRKDNIVTQELDGEVLIYDLAKNKAFCLNETSALVWEMCDGNKSVSEISEDLGKKLNSPANEDLVWLAIDQLKKESLIANGEELITNFEGINRREVIKKIGLGTMVALPVVAGLIAPSAIHAGSCAGVALSIQENNPCTASCQCRGRVGAGPGGFSPSVCCDATPVGGGTVCRENGGDCEPGTTLP